jgi:drug/metabolite transporter (DMT)-like permease
LRLVAVALGFAGVLVMLLPRMDGLGLAGGDLVGVLCAIGSAFCSAAVVIQIRRLARTERPGTIAFYFAALCTLAGLATVPLGWVRPALPDLVLLVMIGLLGGMAQIAMTVSFACAEASLLAPFEYLTIVWSVLFGILLFAEWPALLFYPAALLVVGAAALVAFDQQRLASIRPRSRAAA